MPGIEKSYGNFMSGAIAPYVSVITGARMAPAHRFVTGLLLAVLWVCVAAFIIFTAAVYGGRSESGWWVMVIGFATLASATTACVRIHHQEMSGVDLTTFDT